MGLAPEETLTTLIGNLESSDAILRQNSAWALREFKERGRPGVPSLVRCLKDKEDKVREYAALALGDIGLEPDLVVPALLENLQDPDLDIRTSTALALGAFGERAKAAAPKVRKLIHEIKSNGASRQWLVEVLEQIDPNSSQKQ
jgi:HEAT repeat protein